MDIGVERDWIGVWHTKGIAQLEEYADIAGTNQLIASRGTATRHIEGCTVSEERTARGRSVHQEVVCGYRS